MIRKMLTALALAIVVQADAEPAVDALRANLTSEVRAADDSLTNVLVMIFRSAKIHGGIINVNACGGGSGPKVSVRLAAGLSVQQALESIRSAGTSVLMWQTGQGVVDVAIGGHRPPILDFRIDKAEWRSDEAITLAVSRLFQMPSVQRRLKGLGLTPGLETMSISQAPPQVTKRPPLPPATRSQLKGVSVMAALNGIVRSYPNGSHWTYDERRCGTDGTYVVSAR